MLVSVGFFIPSFHRYRQGHPQKKSKRGDKNILGDFFCKAFKVQETEEQSSQPPKTRRLSPQDNGNFLFFHKNDALLAYFDLTFSICPLLRTDPLLISSGCFSNPKIWNKVMDYWNTLMNDDSINGLVSRRLCSLLPRMPNGVVGSTESTNHPGSSLL